MNQIIFTAKSGKKYAYRGPSNSTQTRKNIWALELKGVQKKNIEILPVINYSGTSKLITVVGLITGIGLAIIGKKIYNKYIKAKNANISITNK